MPSGLKEVAEKRPEFVKSSKGLELFTSPTILGNDYTGAEVIRGTETADILDNVSRMNIVEGMSKQKDDRDMKMIADAIEQTFSKHMDKQTYKLIKGLKQSSTDHRHIDSMNKYKS